jgi:hypothetical protein
VEAIFAPGQNKPCAARRLDESGGITEKPKGMHWRTYRRLLVRVVPREQAVFASAMTMVNALGNFGFNGWPKQPAGPNGAKN